MKRIDRDGCEHVNGPYVNYSDVEGLQSQLDAAKEDVAKLNMENMHYKGLLFSAQGTSLAKVKADGIREGVAHIKSGDSGYSVNDLLEYANNIEQSGQ